MKAGCTLPRQILAEFDAEHVIVYQAFVPEIVAWAVEHGTFGGGGFKFDRMTWIKPSLGWMLYRSGYASKPGQTAVARIRVSHDGFLEILRRAVPTTFALADYACEDEWRRDLDRQDVRVQWDPDRDHRLQKLPRRAIQLGLRGETVRQYVEEWILGVDDMTALARACERHDDPSAPAGWPDERVYPIGDAAIVRRVAISNERAS